MEFIRDFFILLGRLCISTMFLWAAYEKLRNWDRTAAFMRTKHIPQLKTVMPLFFGLKIVGALFIFFGFYTQIGALFLIIVTAFSLYKIHPFWQMQGEERTNELSKFRKETAILGGLLLLLAMGGGHFGVGS